MKSTKNASVSSKRSTSQFRRSALASACVLALAAGNAAAQSSTFTFDPALPPALLTAVTPNPAMSLTTFLIQELNDQINVSVISAQNNSTVFTETHTGGNSPFTVSTNTIQAISRGNIYLAPLNPGDPNPKVSLSTLGTGDTLGMLSSQLQEAGKVTSVVNGGQASIVLSTANVKTNSVTNNPILALTTVNQADQSATGKLSNYSSGTLGSIDANSSATVTSTVDAGIALVNQQIALNAGAGAGSSARVVGSSVLLDLNQTTNTITASQTVTGNSLAAQYQVNGGSNMFNAFAGSGDLNGSVAVSNSQANVESAPSTNITARVSTSNITADLTDGAGGATKLNGPLTVSDNSISASSIGNMASGLDASGNVVDGNSIILGKGVNLVGPGSVGSNSLTAANNNLTAALDADLVLLNGQGNQNTGLKSVVTDGTITALADKVNNKGVITLDTNTVSAAVTGNSASNRIETNATNVTGSIAAANFQANDATNLVAINRDADISVNAGQVGTTMNGTVSVSGNQVSATSTGSSATTTVQPLATGTVTLTGTGAGATANTTAFGSIASTAGVGATANNFQGNYGEATPITARVVDSDIRADFFDQAGGVARVGLNGAAVTLDTNAIQGNATGNTATTQMFIGGGSVVSGTAAVGNGQFNGNVITGVVRDSGLGISALDAKNSTVTANGNQVTATGLANGATNTLSVGAAEITAGTSPIGASGTNTTVGTNTSTSGAAFAIASGQKNEAPVSSRISGAVPLVQVDISGLGSTGITGGSNVSVSDNLGIATTTGNDVNNTLVVTAGNSLQTATGAAGQVASVSNLQQNLLFQVDNTATASVNTSAPQMMGIVYGGPVKDSNLSVLGNHVKADITGNLATNTLVGTFTSYGSTPPTAGTSGLLSSNPGAGTTLVTNEFSLVNRQDDNATARSATVTNANIGIDTVAGAGAISGGSNLAVTGNTTTAQGRNNDATNTLGLVGQGALITSLSTGAGLLNEQTSSTPLTATVVNATDRIQAASTVSDSTLSLTNTVEANAIANLSKNTLSAAAVNITGNSNGTTAGSNITTTAGVTTLTINADFGLGNSQTMTKDVTSSVEASNVVNGFTTLTNTTTTVSGNQVKSTAQANSAGNLLTLDAVNVGTATAGVASFQNATGNVSASQTTQAATNSTFAIIGTTTVSSSLSVSGNKVTVLAGQNEAGNLLQVTGTTINGAGFNAGSSFDPAAATTGSDFSVLNVQSAGTGNVTATALPGLIGVNVPSIGSAAAGSSLTVSDNQVKVQGTVNNATNALNLIGGSTLNAAGAVDNVQTNLGGAVTASIGDAANAVNIGAPFLVALNTTPTTVSNNLLSALAGGNTSTNSLQATASNTIGPAGGAQPTTPTFAVLNFQNNLAATTASVTNATIGLTATGGALVNSPTAVIGNVVLASAYGNSASNSLITSALTGNSNQSSASLVNSQFNSASVSALISGVRIGVSGGSSTGSAGVTSNNASIAQAIGNSASNTISTK
jgi:hypothetical protein